MSKRTSAAESESQPQELSAEGRLPGWGKAILSVALLIHLTAVFVAPLEVACNSSGSRSPAINPLRAALDPYISAMFLDHGYFFFAPQAGPNHLVDYKVEFADGRTPVEGRFPNLATERPRLLYHRYFMLSESLFSRFAPAERPPEPSPPPLTVGSDQRANYELEKEVYDETLAGWQRQRDCYEAMKKSIERHLLASYGGEKVTLKRIEHRQPLPDVFERLRPKLNAADSYVELPETISRGSR